MKEDFLDIRDCVVNIDLERIRGLVREALDAGLPPYQIFMEGVTKGLDIVGQKYEVGEYFLSELIGAAQVVKEAMDELGPHLQSKALEHTGTVVIGTVKGDLHDIGKNIVKMLMIPAGFKVYDLGVDVPPEKFIDKVRETNADIVALSSLLTTTMGEMKVVIEELKKSGLHNKVKVIIGGAPISVGYAREIGADEYGKDAAHGVRICKKWMGKGE